MIRDEARVFSFVARVDQVGPLSDLDLPKQTRIVCLYRDGEFLVPDDHARLKAKDEVVLITHRDNLDVLGERFETAR
jgi:trk system potassium uptake protein TrkA